MLMKVKRTGIFFLGFRRILAWIVVAFFLVSGHTVAAQQVGLYDVWELSVTNTNSYSNPFNYDEIELQAVFTSPSEEDVAFFGFHDGDGNGGQNGNVWKLRFMPDAVGTWAYTYTWTDATPGNSGSFEVVDTGLPGPLRVATDNPWYFENARGQEFDWRGYNMHLWRYWGTEPFNSSAIMDELEIYVEQNVAAFGYNAVQFLGPGYYKGTRENPGHHWWYYNGSSVDVNRFEIRTWITWDRYIDIFRSRDIYVFPFCLVSQWSVPHLGSSDIRKFFRYYVARSGVYWNHLGYSLTWEWAEGWSESEVTGWMSNPYNWNPTKPLLSAHDTMRESFAGWGGFSMRQRQARTIFDGNGRDLGQSGGVQGSFINKPIVGSEDLWLDYAGSYGNPQNASQLRRGAWGSVLAGIMPLLSEWDGNDPEGDGTADAEARRLYDFLYSKTRYRGYVMLNSLVSSAAKQICSGIPGTEYLVYDEDGGYITIDLSGASSSDLFSVLWFDPTNGNEQDGGHANGGAPRTLSSPYSHDTVLLLGGAPPDSTPPTVPQSLDATPHSEHQIDLNWQAASDPESGIQRYQIYRDGSSVGQASNTSYSDINLQESTTYSYEVSAVNGAGLESAKSAPDPATTFADGTPPTILSARALGATQVDVEFSEPVEQASSEDESNYGIDQGITVFDANLDPDLMTVHLTTSEHIEGIIYTITVNDVRDRASVPNTIAPNSTASYQLSLELEVSNLNKANYETGELGLGDQHYVDRTFTIVDVPPEYEGLLWCCGSRRATMTSMIRRRSFSPLR